MKRGRRLAPGKVVLVLAVAWSTLGMQVHVWSGPLAPESCIQAVCRLFLPEASAGTTGADAPTRTSPERTDPADEGEDGAETPLSLLKAVCLSPVDRNHRRWRRRESTTQRSACHRQSSSPALGRLAVLPADCPTPPPDLSFQVCRLLF